MIIRLAVTLGMIAVKTMAGFLHPVVSIAHNQNVGSECDRPYYQKIIAVDRG